MATLNREAIEQEIGKRFEKIEKTLERTLEKTLEKAIGKAAVLANSPAATRAQAAAEKAKKSLDDVLLGLEHKGYNVKQPQDLIQTVGRRVLERASSIAEDVRTQVVAQPYSPEWLKNVTDVAVTKVQKHAGAKASSTKAGATEADAALATDSAGDGASVQADSRDVSVNPATRVETTVAAGATEADGELAESAEDSKEEREAGTIVKSESKSATKAAKKASRKK